MAEVIEESVAATEWHRVLVHDFVPPTARVLLLTIQSHGQRSTGRIRSGPTGQEIDFDTRKDRYPIQVVVVGSQFEIVLHPKAAPVKLIAAGYEDSI